MHWIRAALAAWFLVSSSAALTRAQSALEAGAPATLSAPSAAELNALFDGAQRDPDLIVPLVLGASARMAEVDGDTVHALAERLAPFSRRAFFGSERLAGMERLSLAVHEVASGEIPGRIAKRYKIDAHLFERLNEGYDDRRLRVGQKLKVFDLSEGGLQLVADRHRYRLAAWLSLPAEGLWVLVAYVPIGIGALESPTPEGSTFVTKRVRDPQWTDPVSGRVYAAQDEGNVLGGYWIELDRDGIGEGGIGLHGYTGGPRQEWLEKRGSNGCLRLLQDDVDCLFDIALPGTRVVLGP